MDQVTFQNLTDQLTNNPMNLLEIPESIFEVFEADLLFEPKEGLNSLEVATTSAHSSNLPSLYCSRCQSMDDLNTVANLNEFNDEIEAENTFEPLMTSDIGGCLEAIELGNGRALVNSEEVVEENALADIDTNGGGSELNHQDTG